MVFSKKKSLLGISLKLFHFRKKSWSSLKKKRSSTLDVVRQLFDNFVENIDQKKYSCAVFLDLKKNI